MAAIYRRQAVEAVALSLLRAEAIRRSVSATQLSGVMMARALTLISAPPPRLPLSILGRRASWLRPVAAHAARARHGSARQSTASESAAGTGRVVELAIDADVTQRGQVLIQARRLPVSRLARRGCYPFHH
jgi:hypothetical protein